MLIGFIRNEAALMLLSGTAGRRSPVTAADAGPLCPCHLQSRHTYLLLRPGISVIQRRSCAGAPAKTAAQLRPVPEPMIQGNYEGNSYCMRGQAFRKAVTGHEVGAHGPL